MKRLALLGRNVWVLTRGYWRSEEWRSAWALLITVIGLGLGLVYISVQLNTARRGFYDALQAKDQDLFFETFGWIVILIMIYLAAFMARYFLQRTLQLRWRRWLTAQYMNRWLANRAFYRMRFYGGVDNPDQRISEDVRDFIDKTLLLGLDFISSATTLVSFTVILWNLSGSLSFSVAGFAVVIPGYMFWAAVLWSGAGSVIAHLVGKPLIRISNRQQAVEADFRFSLVRMREEAEGIALYGGEEHERRFALGRFRALFDNFKRLILYRTRYSLYENFIGQLAAFFPLVAAAPRYFSGAIQLGILMQISGAFAQVNDALSWFIGNYNPSFADWRANVDRLIGFDRELDRAASERASGTLQETQPDKAIDLDQVGIALPDGTPLLDPVTLHLAPHQPALLQGGSGMGKSTIFRVLAGLWPFSSGRIRLPEGARPLFLPQRPYMPIGTLRAALWFPDQPPPESDERSCAALRAVDLPALQDRLDEAGHWSQILSPGEQQRLALARALLLEPDWLFLDEATSAMDEAQEAALYRHLKEALPRTTIVSIGHRHSLIVHHDRLLTLTRTADAPGRLVEGSLPA